MPKYSFMVWGFVLIVLLGTPLVADDHANVAPGKAVDQSFHQGDIDSINLFNGSLTVTIPLGQKYPVSSNLDYQFTLVANSNPWLYDNRVCDPNSNGCTVTFTTATPNAPCSNAGLGWRLSFGSLNPCLSTDDPADSNSGRTGVIYEGPDGSQHSFYATLHEGETEDIPPAGGIHFVQYTRDGTYLRLRQGSQACPTCGTNEKEIDFPDGTIHHFDSLGNITQIRNRFLDSNGNPANFVNFAYFPVSPNNPSCSGPIPGQQPQTGETICWVITDSTGGRKHIIYFRADPNWPGYLVSRVVLAAFKGLAGEYDFTYADAATAFSFPANNSLAGDGHGNTTLPFLQSVSQPDNEPSSYVMSYNIFVVNGTSQNPNYSGWASGSLIGVTYPTGGGVQWSYTSQDGHQGYHFPTGPYGIRRQTNVGVRTRTLVNPGASPTLTNPGGTAIGTWSYDTNFVQPPPGSGPAWEVINTVTDPLMNITKRYFSVGTITGGIDGTYAGPGSLWNYGQQFSPQRRDPANSNLFLSEEIIDSSGSTKRRIYRRYDHDTVPNPSSGVFPDVSNKNGRLAAESTVYQDDGTTAGWTNSNFDGLGHYRQNQTDGTFPGNNVRTSFTNFNPNSGQYPSSYNPPSSTTAWVLNTSTNEYVSDSSGTMQKLLCYDTATGFLNRSRSYVANSQAPNATNNNDLLKVFTQDPSGNVLIEQSYGGDIKNNAGSADCTAAISGTPEYQIDHQYQSGVLSQSTYLNPTTQHEFSWHSLDYVIDPYTGLPTESRDTAGIQTKYQYDAMGRIFTITPAQSAVTNYQHHAATSNSQASLTVVMTVNPSSPPGNLTILPKTTYKFDGLGRLQHTDRTMPDGSISSDDISYNENGWKKSLAESESKSSLNPAGNVTSYSGYDPFGRPGRIQRGDQSTTTLIYQGVQTVTSIVTVHTPSGNNSSTTTDTYDRFGRLVKVNEVSGSTVVVAYQAGQAVQFASPPVFSLAPGTYVGAQAVTLSDATSAASIYYSFDPNKPQSNWTLYTGPIQVTTTGTLSAYATAPGVQPSTVATASYTITDFSIGALSPGGWGTFRCGSLTYRVYVSFSSSAVGSVTLGVSPNRLPAGAQVTFNPPSVNYNQSTSTMTITIPPGVPLQTYIFTVTGQSTTYSNLFHNSPYAGLTVQDFSLSVTPNLQSMSTPGSATYTVSASGFDTSSVGYGGGTVGLNISGLPAAATATFSPMNITSNGSSTLTITSPLSTLPRSYPLTITGTGYTAGNSSGCQVHTATTTLGINKPRNDRNADGMSDLVVWRPANQTFYYYYASSSNSIGDPQTSSWGQPGDIPVSGDFDGDGKMDFAIWRPSDAFYGPGYWWVSRSSDGVTVRQQWGQPGDIPVPGDYDGDGKTDFAIWRPSTGTWWVLRSSDGVWATRQWGTSGDIPVPGDYDGDGKTDFAVWRPSTASFYVLRSSDGTIVGQQWGEPGDIPVPADYDGDGKTDFAVWRPSTTTWWVLRSSDGTIVSQQWGQPGDIPVPADYDGDGKTDLAVWSPTGPNAGLWHVIRSGDGTYYNQGLGETGDIPLGRPVGQATVVDPNGPQLCGAEGSLCSFSGLTMDVTYGLNGTFKLLTNVTDLLNCSANTFGTVAPNTAGQRNCYTEASGYGSMAGPGPSGFTFCSAENNTCTLPGPGNYDVAFGANDRFQVLMNLPPSSGPCSASYFGASTGQDSIPAWGMVRACYYRSSSGTGVPSGFSSTACGSEGALCQVTGRNVDVAYGLNGTFNVRTNIKDLFFCGSGIFGPVLPNTPGQRNCYVRDSDPGNMVGPAPTGYQLCGNENQTCSFQGETMDVAFGTSGTFILFTKVQNSVSCTVSNFGDPTPGIVKACYVRPSH